MQKFPTSVNDRGNVQYGINNNNFYGKQTSPSTIEPNHSGNPFGNFNPTSTNSMKNRNNNNFNQAFKPLSQQSFNRNYDYQTNQLIGPIDYSNQNDILHNNINEKVLDEYIMDYRINIDSLDRDIRVYPNPFDFVVKFNPSSSSRVRTEVLKNGQLETINDCMSGPPKPHILKEFKNVRYVQIECVILPQGLNTDLDEKIINKERSLLTDRFIILEVKELDCNRIFCTSDDSVRLDPKSGNLINIPKEFARILPDSAYGDTYYKGYAFHGSKIFKTSKLGNINSLTFKFYDSCGIPLEHDNLYTYNDMKKADKKGKPIPITNIRHPLNKELQVNISIIIGAVESQINNKTNYVC